MKKFNQQNQAGLLEGLNDTDKFIEIYNKLVDDLNEIGEKYGVDSNNLLHIYNENKSVYLKPTAECRQMDGAVIVDVLAALAKYGLLSI